MANQNIQQQVQNRPMSGMGNQTPFYGAPQLPNMRGKCESASF